MIVRRPSCLTAFAAALILLSLLSPAYPSYSTEAAHEYHVACQRLARLKKSPARMRYRSYWIDCIRTFRLVEHRYPKSPSGAAACFDGAGVYADLYRFNQRNKDRTAAVNAYGHCRDRYPRNARAPEALYHVVELSLDGRHDPAYAAKTYHRMKTAYARSPWTRKAGKLLHAPAQPRQKRPAHDPPTHHATAQTRSNVVSGIRYWSGGSYTRIVVDGSAPVKFQTQELKRPDRLVFDIVNSRLGAAVNRSPLPVHDGILKEVRASQFNHDTVRVVLDLANIESYVAFPLHEPERLVIDVTGSEGAATPPEPATAASQSATPPTPPAVSAQGGSGERLSLSRQLGLKIRTIAIDAGHGGKDPGATGAHGLREKDVTLAVAKRLAVLVRDRLHCKVVMTRTTDVFIPLEERPAIARTKGADLFISIHVNANPRRSTRGITTYIQGLRASDRDAIATAARENATTNKTLSLLANELTNILKGLRLECNDEDSINLANDVQTSLVDTVRPIKGRVVNLGVKRAFFYVLINTGMPSILTEIGFISNSREEKLLRTSAYRDEIAEAIFKGVKEYVESRAPKVAGR